MTMEVYEGREEQGGDSTDARQSAGNWFICRVDLDSEKAANN